MNTRVEIFRDGVWRKLRLKDASVVKYNALINKIGEVSTREISHTNTFSLPSIHENRTALGINIFSATSMSKALNSKFPAKYYIEDKLLQQGYVVINNTLEDVININFIDEALEVTEIWGAVTYNELLAGKFSGATIPADYQSAINEMTNFSLDKTSVIGSLSEVGSRGYNLALFPNNLNAIGDEFQICNIDGDSVRLDDSFNPYQSRPIFNAKAFLDLVTESFGYTPIYDSSINWNNLIKTYMVGEGLDQSQVENEGQQSITYPPQDSVAYYNQEYSTGGERDERDAGAEGRSVFEYHPSVNGAIKPSSLPNWTHPSAQFSVPGYQDQLCIYQPNIDQATTGEITWTGTIDPEAQQVYVEFHEIWDNNGTLVFRTPDSLNPAPEVQNSFSITIDKSIFASPPVAGATLVGVIFQLKSVYVQTPESWESVYGRYGSILSGVVTEQFLPSNVVTYDEFGQYVANNITLTHAAPNESIKSLLTGLLEKEGILMSIDGKAKTVKFFSYGLYESKKEQGDYYDWSSYLLKYITPQFNTDYGNKYAKINEIALSSPYTGNRYRLELANQGADSKYKEFTKKYIKQYKDVSKVERINNTTVPYFEYENLGLGLVEHHGELDDLTQVRADGSSQGVLSGLSAISNVNYATIPKGVEEWYRLVNAALKGEASFLLPIDVVRDLDLSKPIYIEELGGFFIIEKISEYIDEHTPVKVDIIKLIGDLQDGVTDPSTTKLLAGFYEGNSFYEGSIIREDYRRGYCRIFRWKFNLLNELN